MGVGEEVDVSRENALRGGGQVGGCNFVISLVPNVERGQGWCKRRRKDTLSFELVQTSANRSPGCASRVLSDVSFHGQGWPFGSPIFPISVSSFSGPQAKLPVRPLLNDSLDRLILRKHLLLRGRELELFPALRKLLLLFALLADEPFDFPRR